MKSFGQLEPTQTIVKLCQWQDLEVEVDEMWSFVGSKKQQRWLWHAIDHGTGKTLAYVSNHQDSAFLALKTLEPFGIVQFYTDGWVLMNAILTRRFRRLARPILKRLSVSI